ncbi:MAG: prepilin-type N-terminal cleavage/methylation domain-containing protein [Rhodocyclaceae bacterium]|nr:prepilin-type N-terminal cleavage/methylation domain-containing protein [Rhodocyclaceae bacterium]
MKNKQGGFTLVEIAIVLVIIGLLLGGVLKGQELITQAKIKNIANDLNGLSAAVYGYQDRYKKFPGDDDQAKARWGATVTKEGGGDGVVGATGVAALLDCVTTDKDVENCRFWQHLRLSGFIGGDSASTLPPQNAAGGVLQVQAGALGLAGLTICTPNLLGKIANAIDAQFDDGKPGTGQVRGTNDPTKLGTKLGDTDAYVDDASTVYVVCKAL